jgi:hypothetical protein
MAIANLDDMCASEEEQESTICELSSSLLVPDREMYDSFR